MDITRLPLNTRIDEPHVPILVSKNISTAKRVIVYIGEACQDLGIFAGRIITKETIASGSAIGFVQAAHSASEEVAVVLANPGQLLWYRRGKKAMSLQSWHAIPRRYAVRPGLRIEPQNYIPGNENVTAHVKSVFEAVAALAYKDVKVDVIGIGDGAEEAVDYLQANWGMWKARVEAIVVGTGYVWHLEFSDERFEEFWGKVSLSLPNQVVDLLLMYLPVRSCVHYLPGRRPDASLGPRKIWLQLPLPWRAILY
jgi:hypothetical protein